MKNGTFWAEALVESWAAAWMGQCGLQQSPRVGKLSAPRSSALETQRSLLQLAIPGNPLAGR